jgi:hypothetical protein
MMDFVLITVGLVAAGMMVELFAAATAPLGYQDENGFHFGPDNCDIANPYELELANPS